MRNCQVGDLLVATTEVDGSVLHRGVCLLVYEDAESAVGVMLNRPMHMSQVPSLHNTAGYSNPSPKSHRLSQLIGPEKVNVADVPSVSQHIDAADGRSDQTPTVQHTIAFKGPTDDPDAGKILMGKSLHFGGPLSGPVVAVHGAAHLAEAEAGDGIFVAAQRDHLEALLQAEQPVPYRLIVGHLGWTQEQLSDEIEGGVWHRVRATNEILSTADEWLWPKLIRSATSGSISRWLGTTHVADSHLLN